MTEARELRCRQLDRWTLHEYGLVRSTNDVAGGLPAWHAVRAESQSAGRGRWRRVWVSDVGGLWISAVLPLEGDLGRWLALPLAVGLAVVRTLALAGVSGLRLRWPNDVLLGEAKLAGLLLEHLRPGLAVAGIGINVDNAPASVDASLRHTSTRLRDVSPAAPPIDQLAASLLVELGRVHNTMRQQGFAALLPEVNALWQPRQVQLDLGAGRLATGSFGEVDAEGRLALREAGGQVSWHSAGEVIQLKELS